MYLVFDVGATFIKYAWMTEDGDIIEKSKTPTPVDLEGKTFQEAIDEFVETIGGIYDVYKNQGNVDGIAMGLPGQIDVKRGIVYNGGGIRYLDKVCLQDLISKRCQDVLVALENDGKCAALAEVWKGNAKDVKDACVLVFGTGIGGGIVRNRKVIHGKHLLAGETSFILTDITREDLDKLPPGEDLMESMDVPDIVKTLPYTWTTTCSAVNMCQRIADELGLPREDVTGEKVYQWAREGQQKVIDMLEDTYFTIAKTCLSLFVILDPQIILIGGGISAEPQFVEGIVRYVNQLKRLSNVYRNIKIDTCKFLNDSNLLGALYNFKQKYKF
ncbi:MAG: ROK family protein [Lachnospiraceae bacterium]|nr:ROK family protein [Lachnospiraceae bacterium]